jgi:predicted AAA+ superfamily ATPase
MSIGIDAPNIHGQCRAMIDSESHKSKIVIALKRSPIVALLGARQCGKTTLAGLVSAEGPRVSFDMDSAQDHRPQPA